MLSIKDAKATLQQMGMSEEETTEFENIIDPFINFHKFLMEKENIDSTEAEKRTQEETKNFVSSNIDGTETQTQLFEIAGRGFKEYALNVGYDIDKSENLENNLIELVNIFEKITTNIQKKKKG